MGWHVADGEEKGCQGMSNNWVLYLTMEEEGERESSGQREREREKDRQSEQQGKLLRAVLNKQDATWRMTKRQNDKWLQKSYPAEPAQ